MTRHKKFQILAAAAVLCINGLVQADEGEGAPPADESPKSIPFEKGPYEVRVERSHFIETRDGVRLMTDLYFPEGHEGRLPVILERTPYNKATHRNSNPDEPINSRSIGYYFASHGYVVAVQDRRGKFESEGDYTIGYGDVNDAGDTLDWFEKQAWFNGRVGMIGCSIPGGNVVKAAMSRHKTLKGLVPQSAAFGHGTAGGTMARGFIRGGVQNMTMPLWTHSSGSKIFYRPSMRLDREEYLKIVDLFEPAPKESSVAEMLDSETGHFTKETMDTLLHLPAVEIDDVMGSPPSDWDNMIAGAPMGPFWTGGDYLDDEDMVAGGGLHINSWHDYGVNETFLQFEHFRKHDSYVYDPADPVIVEFTKSVFAGAYDRAEVQMRDDILVYMTPPLHEPLEMTGRMRARIWLSTDVPDTDLTVTIVDVFPDGRAFPLQKGLLRLRYREGYDKEVMMEPGKVYPIDLDMLVGANQFNPGHRIGIEVTSSDFPGHARNLNTGGDNARDARYQSATVKIHHGADTPSHIESPTIRSNALR